MLTTLGKIIFTVIILATITGFSLPVIARIRIIKSGLPDRRFNQLGRRIASALSKILLQRCTLKDERLLTGFMHVFIFYGALTFDTMTLNHTLEGFFADFYLFGESGFGLFFSLIIDLFAVLVIIGVLFFIVRRFIIRPKAYRTTAMDSAVIYTALILVTLSYLYFEFFSIALHPETERLAFIGGVFAPMIRASFSPEAINSHFHIAWWLHILLVFGFIAYVPYSKYFHMFAGSFNLLVNRDRPLGELKAMDIEKSEIFGIENALDYTWKDMLDTFACMECGRCQDVCPAFASDKPLSPKMIIFNLKAHLLKNKKQVTSGDREQLPALMGDTFSEGEIWTCTTCGACMHVCPVEIEHIPKIIGIRQGQVLMESRFPGELNNFFRGMETNSNPWNIGFSERAAWTEGLTVNRMSENKEVEYLFFVGCAGSFDEEGKKIARSLVQILDHAGIRFAILGEEEKCCGDSARRLGNEYLFQMQAAENIENFVRYRIKKIVTICPHGFNAFSHEYPGLLPLLADISSETKDAFRKIDVIHHTQLIARLLKEQRLDINPESKGTVTYHDSCYLGRHNGIVSQPREILSSLSGLKLIEMQNNRRHNFCCGAGGGLMWTEESLGTRINHMRTEEVLKTGAGTAVTSCPFCQTMLMDGLKDKDQGHIPVMDIAQLVTESLVRRS